MAKTSPYILLDDQLTHSLRYYTEPVEIITAYDVEDIDSAFEQLKDYHQQGFYLAGYVSYDLGHALEAKLSRLMAEKLAGPLLQFGVFKSVSAEAPTDYLYMAKAPVLNLKPAWTEAEYTKRFDRVMDYIEAGDVYQINLTFPMTGEYEGPASQLYAGFRNRQKGRYGGIVSLGSGPEIISLSPELFFRKENTQMSMRPMKGTRPRGADADIDKSIAEDMRGEIKSQAENLMIVDLLRNDLSRISKSGSVQVPELFALETYPTLHQMTSRVTSQLIPGTDFKNIFKSLFPCGSVTGAPKIRAMEIIDELENTPRGAYCGGLGYIDPNGDACFNVSIRTMILSNGELRYNVGSGLVLDSEAADEYAECLLKADVLRARSVDLIETLRWEPQAGFIRLDRHKNRLKKAAKNLNYPFNEKDFNTALKTIRPSKTTQRLRLTLNKDGQINCTQQDCTPLKNITFAISKHALTKAVQSTAQKISSRDFYEGERQRISDLKDIDEVIFLNAEGRLCEGSFTSLFIQKDDQLFTPSLKAGLLPGILREELIETGKAVEAELTLNDLYAADKIFLGNSLRGLMEAQLIFDETKFAF